MDSARRPAATWGHTRVGAETGHPCGAQMHGMMGPTVCLRVKKSLFLLCQKGLRCSGVTASTSRLIERRSDELLTPALNNLPAVREFRLRRTYTTPRARQRSSQTRHETAKWCDAIISRTMSAHSLRPMRHDERDCTRAETIYSNMNRLNCAQLVT